MPQGSFLELTERVAVVTGAGQGIGRAVAVTLGRLGARVALCDRDEELAASTAGALRDAGHSVVVSAMDVREPEARAEFVDEVVARFGRIDALVNNVGGGFRSAFADLSPGGEAALISENFTSATGMIKLALPHMPDGSAIVNVTSVEAHRAAPGFAVYAAMKAALASLTKTLAVELGHRRVRVNCVAPDVITTPGAGDMGVRAPLAIEGRPEHVAGAVAFLLSDQAAFITGVTVAVDGGTGAAGGWFRAPDGSFHVAASHFGGAAG